MIVTSAEEFLAAIRDDRFPVQAPTTARAAFLVTPNGFSLAAESATDNAYMDLQEVPDAHGALREHAALARALCDSLPIVSFAGDPRAPDGVFPNNVFATAPGRLIVGRMRHPIRQQEANRRDIRAWFKDLLGYSCVDLSGGDFVAELTGSLVIDRGRGIGYCGLSERCDLAGARAMHEAFGLQLTYCFPLAASEYHTNVVLAVLASRAAIIAEDGFANVEDARAISSLYQPHVVQISAQQKASFAGNAIALDEIRLWMSATAKSALTTEQVKLLAKADFRVESVALDEIEKAGGSLRCCVAEIY
jgi:hypothetical protein